MASRLKSSLLKAVTKGDITCYLHSRVHYQITETISKVSENISWSKELLSSQHKLMGEKVNMNLLLNPHPKIIIDLGEATSAIHLTYNNKQLTYNIEQA
ncbi:hypothetical protein YC2023_110421 [Brassica napus]